MPIPTAKSRAVDTDDNCVLSNDGLPLLLTPYPSPEINIKLKKNVFLQEKANSIEHELIPPEWVSFLAFFEKSSATKEVATLRRGMLKSFDMMLKIDMETPAEPNSTAPSEMVSSRNVHKSK